MKKSVPIPRGALQSPAVRDAMRSFGDLAGAGAADTTRVLGTMYGRVIRQAAAMSVLELVYQLGILVLLVTPLVWIMRRPRRGPA